MLYISVSYQVNFSHKMIAKAVGDRHADRSALPQLDGLLFLITRHYNAITTPLLLQLLLNL